MSQSEYQALKDAHIETSKLRNEHALKNANEWCRVAYTIGEREGVSTNWAAFTGQLRAALERQRRILYPQPALETAKEGK